MLWCCARRLGCILVTLTVAAVSSASEPLLQDDFTAALGRYDFLPPQAWKIKEHACRFTTLDRRDGFALANVGELATARWETEITIDRRQADGFVMAGLTLYADPDNHWRLILVGSPAGKTYFELTERHQGVHQAQMAAESSGTRLAIEQQGTLKSWECGRPYHLMLTLTDANIEATVRDLQTGQSWQCRDTYGNARAVRSGRVGLSANGVEGSFRNLVVEGTRVKSTVSLTAGSRGTAVIIPDETGKVAPLLQTLLAKNGFGAIVLPWDDLPRARLSAVDVDLLVLADARRIPADAARIASSFLNARGKLIAVGAPAFGHLLLKVGTQYVASDKYREALYDQLQRRPIALDLKSWSRGCRDKSRKAELQPEPMGQASFWKVTADVDGWDTYGFSAENLFADGHDVLAFRARGDAATPELMIECMERDGSRWMTKVELSTELRRYVLRPADFAFWPDSKTKRGTSDRFNPAQVSKVLFGLAQSQTPQCGKGVHSYWIGDLATAANPDRDRPEITTPDIDGLSPSHRLYPLANIATVRPAHGLLSPSGNAIPTADLPFSGKGYAAVGRETGIGLDRQRPVRWIRVLDAFDQAGRNRGPLAWLMLGETCLPGAMWANLGLADDLVRQLTDDTIVAQTFTALARSMARGCLLLEAGSRQFSYSREESVEMGALVVNAGRKKETLTVATTVSNRRGTVVFRRSTPVTVLPGEQRDVRWQWDPKLADLREFPCTLSTQLVEGSSDGRTLDTLSHPIELQSDRPAPPRDFVTTSKSNFLMHDQSWFMRGMNYWPNSQGGRNSTRWLGPSLYDPQLVERDLAQMEALGINFLSGIQGGMLGDPSGPLSSHDLHDFLERCQRHGMKVFYMIPGANPLAGGTADAAKRHIEAAGIKNHPAILAWELAWEPIYYSGTKGGGMDFLLSPWNAWIVQRYGSLEAAERDWGQTLARVNGPRVLSRSARAKLLKAGQTAPDLPEVAGELGAMPEFEWLDTHGPWDRVTAAFRRFFSDYVGRAYGNLIRELRRYDENHLITFRFGACGIPNKACFAHSHSAGVAKHCDFLCPEGYNLAKAGPAQPADPDELRKGGLVTLYYRFLSREKPVVWMEFGTSVNGMHTPWHTGMEHVRASELERQRTEFGHYYQMFVESGARGAAPWWLPGGYRLGEMSDFGLVDPDGTERPACAVLRKYQPKFAQVGNGTCIAPIEPAQREPGRPVILLDLDAHYADAWNVYGTQYLDAIRSGHLPYLATRGTGTTSADCPLLAVGNTICNGRNPPQYLNAEFNTVEFRESERAVWRELPAGDLVTAKLRAKVSCRASAGNLAEATWLAPEANHNEQEGRVYLSCTVAPSGRTTQVPISSDTRYLDDDQSNVFSVPLGDEPQQIVTLEMSTIRKTADGSRLIIPFGEKRTFTVRLLP